VKNILRIALPALAELTGAAPLDYVWFDRKGQPARRGALSPAGLATAFPRVPVQAVLHPRDAIVASVQVPAVAAARFEAAVRGALEALVLGDPEGLAIGHGTRGSSGEVAVAWADGAALARAWLLLSQAGLMVRALIPAQTLGGEAAQVDEPLAQPKDPRWAAEAPDWSLALPHLAPRQPSPWRAAWRWAALAAALWIAGLNIHASQLRSQAARLRDGMTAQVREAFPEIPVVLDPVRQARQGYEALLTGGNASDPGDFLSLARAAAQALPFAADQVDVLRYRDRALTLTLAESDGADPHLSEMPAIIQKAAASGIRIERSDNSPDWRIVPAQP
jgi:general secretion pathway protein L